VAIGILASAYMTIIYDIVQDIAENPSNWTVIWIKVGAGLLSALAGIGIVYYLNSKKRSDSSE